MVLEIHFRENKTKCIVFSKEKKLLDLNITHNNKTIKTIDTIEYLGCNQGANLNEEVMAMKNPQKISAKSEFLYKQNEFLNPKIRRLLCIF